MKKWLSDNKWVVGLLVSCLTAIVIIFIPQPSFEKRLLNSGKKALEAHELNDAVGDFIRVVKYAPESTESLDAARSGAETALLELKDYNAAIFFFRHIVRQSQRPAEVRWAQQSLAETYYEKLSNYPQAIMEYQRLLQGALQTNDYSDYRLKVARAYFYMGNFDQAILEANDFLAKKPGDKATFDMLMLKANSLMAQKNQEDALNIYKVMEQKFPAHLQLHEVKMNKSLIFEDRKDWDRAVQELEEIKGYPHPDVIALKIRSIERRKAKKKE